MLAPKTVKSAVFHSWLIFWDIVYDSPAHDTQSFTLKSDNQGGAELAPFTSVNYTRLLTGHRRAQQLVLSLSHRSDPQQPKQDSACVYITPLPESIYQAPMLMDDERISQRESERK